MINEACRGSIANITAPGTAQPKAPSYQRQVWPGIVPAGVTYANPLVARVRRCAEVLGCRDEGWGLQFRAQPDVPYANPLVARVKRRGLRV